VVTLVEICGLDESGSVGSDMIFVRVEIPLTNEVDLFVKNLIHFKKLMVSKAELSGYDKKTRLRFVRDVYD